MSALTPFPSGSPTKLVPVTTSERSLGISTRCRILFIMTPYQGVPVSTCGRWQRPALPLRESYELRIQSGDMALRAIGRP